MVQPGDILSRNNFEIGEAYAHITTEHPLTLALSHEGRGHLCVLRIAYN